MNYGIDIWGDDNFIIDGGVVRINVANKPSLLEITEKILNKLCTKEQAEEKAYAEAGRIGPDEGFALLKEVAAKNGL